MTTLSDAVCKLYRRQLCFSWHPALLRGTGRSIQAKGISPDIEVLQDVPEELKARTDTRGEASLRGHLKSEGDEQTGSQSYIPPDPKDDKALHTALDLIRGIQKNSAYPPNPKTAVPN
jgi:carboxyl-terminal processing protease